MSPPSDIHQDSAFLQPVDRGGLRLTGAARLGDIAVNPVVRESFPLLATACEHEETSGAGTTLASSLAAAGACRRSGDAVECALNGSSTCAARVPESPVHAILEGGPCWRGYRSLIGIALVALDATVDGPDSSVTLPAAAGGGFQRLILAPREEGSDAPPMSIAAVQRVDGEVRLVLGGVSPRPYRVYTSVEEEAMAGGLDEDSIAGLADRALLDAETDPQSAHKLDAAAALLRLAMQEIAASQRLR
ncbi:hypothetical protein BH09GEM1_BH09GEM1_36440 [soil metagenome]